MRTRTMGLSTSLEINHNDDLYIHMSDGVGLASEENFSKNKIVSDWSPTCTKYISFRAESCRLYKRRWYSNRDRRRIIRYR